MKAGMILLEPQVIPATELQLTEVPLFFRI